MVARDNACKCQNGFRCPHLLRAVRTLLRAVVRLSRRSSFKCVRRSLSMFPIHLPKSPKTGAYIRAKGAVVSCPAGQTYQALQVVQGEPGGSGQDAMDEFEASGCDGKTSTCTVRIFLTTTASIFRRRGSISVPCALGSRESFMR